MVAPNREDARGKRRFRARALGRSQGPPRRRRVRRAVLGRGRRGAGRARRHEWGHRQSLQEPPVRQERVARDGGVQRQSHLASEADARRPRRPRDLLVPQRAAHGGERPGRLAARRGRAARAAGGRVPRRRGRRLVPARRRGGAHRAHAQAKRAVRREQGRGARRKKQVRLPPIEPTRSRWRGSPSASSRRSSPPAGRTRAWRSAARRAGGGYNAHNGGARRVSLGHAEFRRAAPAEREHASGASGSSPTATSRDTGSPARDTGSPGASIPVVDRADAVVGEKTDVASAGAEVAPSPSARPG